MMESLELFLMIQPCFVAVFENRDGCRQLGDCELDDVDNGLDEGYGDGDDEGDDEGYDEGDHRS